MIKKSIYVYNNPSNQKTQIYMDLKNKSGIYMWINIINNKKYVGSSINLARRIKDYLNKAYLLTEIKKNNSLIYKALLKYGYGKFRLEILEFCEIKDIIVREQFYIDNYILKYNTLKVARSLLGFKHSEKTKEKLRKINLGRPFSGNKEKLYSNSQSMSIKLVNIETEQIIYLPSIRRAALFIKIHYSYLSICLSNKGFYKGKGYYIVKNKVDFLSLGKINELLTANNIFIVLNTQDNSEKSYNSISAVARDINASDSTLRRYITNKKLYKGLYLITRKI